VSIAVTFARRTLEDLPVFLGSHSLSTRECTPAWGHTPVTGLAFSGYFPGMVGVMRTKRAARRGSASLKAGSCIDKTQGVQLGYRGRR
jgi:hypothetical protein